MKNTFRLATSAMMRPLGEMLFSNGRDQGMAAGANMVRSLAAADFDQSRAQGQQRRNYMQSEQGLGDFFRVAGGDFSGYNTEGLDEAGLQKAKDSVAATMQALALTGDTNYQQFAKGRQDMAVHDAAVYENNPIKAGGLAATFNGGNIWGGAGSGQTFNRVTGQLQGSPYNTALINTEQAQARNYDASANYSNAKTDEVRQDITMVGPDGQPTLGGAFGLSGMGIDDVWDGLIRQESGGRQSAVSPKGAIGVAQVMPGTAPIAAKLAGIPYDEHRYRTDPQYNAALGKAYLKEMHRIFGDMELALGAYNAGPGAMQKAIARDRAAGGNGAFASVARFLPRETQDYVPSIARRIGVSGVPMKYAGPQRAKQMYPTGGDRFTQVDAKHPVFQRQVGFDFEGRPITEHNADQYNRFSRWAQANGYNNQQQAMQAWIAEGMPDAGSTSASEIPADSLAGQLASALMPGFLGGSTRPPSPQASARASSQKVDGRITSKAIMEQAQMSHANPGMVVAQLRKNGIDVPQSVLVELKQQGFSVN